LEAGCRAATAESGVNRRPFTGYSLDLNKIQRILIS